MGAKDHMGSGDWLRGQTEQCVMAIRGKPIVTLTKPNNSLARAGARTFGKAA